MASNSNIEWTDATWNPIRGCSRVSEGCRNCYAEAVAYRFSGSGQPYEGLVRIGSDGKRRREWNGEVRFAEKHLLDPLKWKEPKRIFVNSMSDLFHENVTDDMRDQIFAVMALCPQHTFQVLTKRPDRVLTYFNRPDRGNWSKVLTNPAAWYVWCEATKIQAVSKRPIPSRFGWTTFDDIDTVTPWPLPNVHLGVSCENQAAADERIPLLLQTPAAVRFISAEPLLGPINLHPWICRNGDISRPEQKYSRICDPSGNLDWVIVGGESGPGARWCDVAWIRGIVDQCKSAEVPVFCKQLGAHPVEYVDKVDVTDHSEFGPEVIGYAEPVPLNLRDKKGGDMDEWPHDIRVREFPKETVLA
jgi:protein gp37